MRAWSSSWVVLAGVLAGGPARADEPVPGLPSPQRESAYRTGRGLLGLGGVLAGLGMAGRVALEGFWAGPARLEPGEPFGQWSVPNIMVSTSFANVLVVPGLVAMGFGARRHGAWRVATGRRPIDASRTRNDRRLGWGLLGGGLSLAGAYYPLDTFGEVDGEAVTDWWRNAQAYALLLHYGGLYGVFAAAGEARDV